MSDFANKDYSDIQEMLALLQHWFACFRQCGEMPIRHARGIAVADPEQRWQQLMQLSAVVDKKLLLFRAALVAKEARMFCAKGLAESAMEPHCQCRSEAQEGGHECPKEG